MIANVQEDVNKSNEKEEEEKPVEEPRPEGVRSVKIAPTAARNSFNNYDSSGSDHSFS